MSSVLELNSPAASKGRSSILVLVSSRMFAALSQACRLSVTEVSTDLEVVSVVCFTACLMLHEGIGPVSYTHLTLPTKA